MDANTVNQLIQQGISAQQKFLTDNQEVDRIFREKKPLADIIPELRGDDVNDTGADSGQG